MINAPIRIELTDEQKAQLKPVFDAVNKSAFEKERGTIMGEAFERDGGYAQFRFLDHAQTEIVKKATLAVVEIEKRKEMEARRVEIAAQIDKLEAEKNRIDEQIAEMELRGQAAA